MKSRETERDKERRVERERGACFGCVRMRLVQSRVADVVIKGGEDQ